MKTDVPKRNVSRVDVDTTVQMRNAKHSTESERYHKAIIERVAETRKSGVAGWDASTHIAIARSLIFWLSTTSQPQVLRKNFSASDTMPAS